MKKSGLPHHIPHIFYLPLTPIGTILSAILFSFSVDNGSKTDGSHVRVTGQNLLHREFLADRSSLRTVRPVTQAGIELPVTTAYFQILARISREAYSYMVPDSVGGFIRLYRQSRSKRRKTASIYSIFPMKIPAITMYPTRIVFLAGPAAHPFPFMRCFWWSPSPSPYGFWTSRC